jgi:ferric-dicitrate binding protein FerR (iron transport regulator)
MNDPFDSLQERLTHLEAGEPLETVCADLPEAEAGLLQMAAALRAVPAPERSLNTVSTQRMELIRAAKSFKTLNTLPKTDEVRRLGQPARAQSWWPLALAGSVAAMFVCALVVAALASAVWLWRSSPQPSVAQPHSPAATAVALAAPDPQHAVLAEARGLVEIQSSDGAWAAADAGQTLAAGQRVRTGALSGVSLAFYDGSLARLGPNAEVSVDSLDAQKTGSRVILLSQWSGDSKHDVAHSDDPASRYEVATPSGVGSAKGTSFRVSVTVLLVRFDVDEGVVAVTHLNVTVIVVAGQTTIVPPGEAPEEPVFHISGEGEVTAIGGIWRIGGQTFLTDSSTVVGGDPQVGDWVAVEGRILSDGTRFADRITLLHHSTENQFSFTGTVEVISGTQWTIAGRVVRVDDLTNIEEEIAVGKQVEVRGGIAKDGTWWASSIELTAANSFEFTGVVQSIISDTWTISGISVTVNVSTTIEAGIVVSDVVHVEGKILDDGTWRATSIQKIEAEEETFDFTGVVIGMDPWNVSGVAFETDENTAIDEGIDIGNRVRVKGQVLADGTWLAESITQLDEGKRHHVEFTAKVEHIDPWIVGGVTVSVTEQTKIDNGIKVGDLVTVKGNLLPDGTVVAKKIRLANPTQGCVETSVVVQTINADQIVLLNGQTIPLDGKAKVKGKVNVASVVIVLACADADGNITVVSITVVYQLDALPPPPQDNGGQDKDKDKNKHPDCKDGPGRGEGLCKNDDDDDDH